MAKYLVDLTVEVTVENLVVTIGDELMGEETLAQAAERKLRKSMTILDIKGARSGDDGYISLIGEANITNWGQL